MSEEAQDTRYLNSLGKRGRGENWDKYKMADGTYKTTDELL